ncbi:MAG TPA: hypothetical protein VJ463_02880 [Geothrix sp.]|nr:hypothetical protein [Geothrix sp.]
MDYTPTPSPVPAPEERSAFHFGLWALLTNLLCGCFPVSILLGVLALVRHGRAKARAAAEPDRYAPPAATGMVLGIIGMAWTIFALVYVGIISAIAIPALLGQRTRVRDKAAIENMVGRVGDLVGQYDKLEEEKTAPADIPGRLEGYLRSTTGIEHNPWNPAGPAFDYRIRVVQGLDREGVAQAAESEATTLGQCVFVIEVPPSPGQQGFLAGAVRVREARIPSASRVKVVELD